MKTIKNGAIFIADCHENEKRQNFYNFLLAIKNEKIKTDQLFLMGDIFDFLSFNASFTLEFYAKQIKLLNELSKNLQIFYFEGNHDFNLSRVFPNIEIFPNQLQPVIFKISKKNEVSISHGDNYLGFITKRILMFLRNEKMIDFLDFFDKKLGRKITKMILKSQLNKQIYKEFSTFESFVEKKIDKFDTNYIFEGHFHQGKTFKFENKTYINFESFGVSAKYYIFQKNGENFHFDEIYFKGENCEDR